MNKPFKYYKINDKFDINIWGPIWGVGPLIFGKFNGKTFRFDFANIYNRMCRVKNSIKEYAKYCQVWPQYYIVYSRDCDCYESIHAVKFPTYFHARRSMEFSWQSADGPINYQKVSKKDYEEHEDFSRDAALEAYEDGHPSTIYPSF